MPKQIDLDQIGTGNGQLTCHSCLHSAYYPTTNGGGLWCQTHKIVALDLCGDFDYEPGTDAAECGGFEK
jgi:hypothetical protein